jgi:hypothetical protein
MNRFIEKLIARFEKESHIKYDQLDNGYCFDAEHFIYTSDAIKIVNELAEEYKDNAMIEGQYCWQTCGSTEHCKECNRLCNGSIDYYENYDFMAEEYKGGWIPCSERLPNEGQIVAVTLGNGVVTAGFNGGNGGMIGFYGMYASNDVIAWQPLPVPYKEGE